MGTSASKVCRSVIKSGAEPQAEQRPEAPARPTRDPLPLQPLPDLVSAYSCEILRADKGLVKGCFGTFKAEAFYRPLPGTTVAEGGPPGLRELRHALILALGIVKWADKAGEVIEAEELGEGSYAKVFGAGPALAVKLISDRERPWVHRAAAENSLIADRLGLGPRVFGHGTVEQLIAGHFCGTALLLERLEPLGERWSRSDSEALLADVALLASVGFHNDVKLPNVLRRSGRPTLIDFDLLSEWSVKVAVTSSCIEHDFRPLLEPLGPVYAQQFREYYDLFALTLTLPDGELYRRVLERLLELWSHLEAPILRPILQCTDPEKLTEVPLEVLCRAAMEGVSVNILDLRGNLYAHTVGDVSDRAPCLKQCESLPQLMRSHGIYWP